MHSINAFKIWGVSKNKQEELKARHLRFATTSFHNPPRFRAFSQPHNSQSHNLRTHSPNNTTAPALPFLCLSFFLFHTPHAYIILMTRPHTATKRNHRLLIALITVPALAALASAYPFAIDKYSDNFSLDVLLKGPGWMIGLTAAAFTAAWVRFVFPKMGTSYAKDVALTLLMFPFTGFFTGFTVGVFIELYTEVYSLIAPTIGVLVGLYTSFITPYHHPEMLVPYAAAITLMMVLPRLSKRNTSNQDTQ